MARYLVLDWDHKELHIVSGTIKHGALRVQRVLLSEEAKSPNPAEAEELGKLLRERLKAAGIAPAPAIVCVGRDRLVLKELRFPAVAASEEAAVVRFQTVKELNGPADEVVIDYVPAKGNSGSERRALAVVLRRELLHTYQALCKAAGLKLHAICPRPFGVAACIKATGAQGTVAVLSAAERWAEFCVVRNGTPFLSRSLTAPSGTEAALLGEIRRTLAVYAGQSPPEPVRSLFVADGTPGGSLAQRLQDKVAIPLLPLDPFAGMNVPSLPSGARGTFAGAVGMLHSLAEGGALPINFIKPREPEVARDPNKRKLVMGLALAASLLLALIVLARVQISNRDRELEGLSLAKIDVDRQLAQVEEDARRIKAIGDWSGGEVVWLDELYDLTERISDTNAMRITQLTCEPLPRIGKDAKPGARMTIKGIIDNSQSVDHLIAQLVSDGHYRVPGREISRNTGPDRQTYRQQFLTKIEVEQRPPNRYVRRLPAPPPSRDRREGGFDLGAFFNGEVNP